MAIKLGGNYLLKVKFGTEYVGLNPQVIEEFSIIQDMEKLVPSIRFTLNDPTGSLSHIIPADRGMTRVSVQMGPDDDSAERINEFDFLLYRRNSESDFSAYGSYSGVGLLNVLGMFNPDRMRAHTGNKRNMNIVDSLTNLAINEMKLNAVDISPSLNYSLPLIQPNLSNAEFLKYTARRLRGKDNEAPFKAFVTCSKGKTTLNVKTIEELYEKPVKYKFLVNDKPFEDHYPIFNYRVFDNYQSLGVFGVRSQNYGYFDYASGTWVSATDTIDNFFSLSDYFAIDGDDPTGSKGLNSMGRNNDFEGNFPGRVKTLFYGKVNSLVKMWITTVGLEDLVPGEVVKVFFPHGVYSDNLLSYQYSGFWLAERVIHHFEDTFWTKVLLTRNGVDSDKSTTLIRATNRKTR